MEKFLQILCAKANFSLYLQFTPLSIASFHKNINVRVPDMVNSLYLSDSLREEGE